MKKTFITVLLIAMVGPLVLNLSALLYTDSSETGAILATSQEQKEDVSSDIDINTTNEEENADNENEISEEAELSQSQAPEQNETNNNEVVVARPIKANYDLSTTKGREDYIWDRLISAGFSEVQVAAILGNMYVENTTLKLSLEEAGNNIGYGLIQWSFGRRDNLVKYAKDTGRSVNNIDVQLEFFIHEYNTDGWGAHTAKHAEFRTTESVRRAAWCFCWGFERPNEKYAHEARREQKAVEMYNKHNTVGQKIS